MGLIDKATQRPGLAASIAQSGAATHHDLMRRAATLTWTTTAPSFRNSHMVPPLVEKLDGSEAGLFCLRMRQRLPTHV